MTLTHLDVLQLEYPDGEYPDCAKCGEWQGTVWRFKNNMVFGFDPDTGRDRPVSESGEQAMLQFLLEHPDERRSDDWRLICPGCRDQQVAARLSHASPGPGGDTLTGSEAHHQAVEAYGGCCFLCESQEGLQLRAEHPDFWTSIGLPRNPGSDQRIKRARRLVSMGFPPGVVRVWCGSCARRWWGKRHDPQALDALKRLVAFCGDDPALLDWLR